VKENLGPPNAKYQKSGVCCSRLRPPKPVIPTNTIKIKMHLFQGLDETEKHDSAFIDTNWIPKVNC